MLRETSPARIFARPTADNLWLGPTQESALRQLSVEAPVQVLLGPQSSGRSSLLRHLANGTDQARGLVIRGPQGLRNAALRALMDSARLPAEQLPRREMRRILAAHIRDQQAHGFRAVLAIDDADTLSAAALDEIIRLQRKTGPAPGVTHILLSLVHIDAGGSAAADFVRRCEAPAIAVLSWLGPNEVGWYIHWRMHRFGLAGTFTDAAVRLIAKCSQGCYAAVDHICQMALLLLRNRDAEQVDVLLVREAIRALKRPRLTREAAPASELDAKLIVTRDGKLLRQVSVGARLLIGRGHFNDITLDSTYLSRHHLAIIRGERGYFLSDLNSVNGVLLNGNRVQSAPVGNRDVIRIGPYRLKLIVANELPRDAGADAPMDLADTAEMPAPGIAEPAFLKVIQ